MKRTIVMMLFLSMAVSVFGAEPIVWNKENRFKSWGSAFRCKTTQNGEALVITVTGVDSNICNNNVKIEPEDYTQLQIEYRAKDVPAVNNGKLYYATATMGFNEGHIWKFSGLKSDGEWHTLTVKNDSKLWTEAGTVLKIRLDIIEQGQGTIEIRSITFFNPGTK